MNTTLRTPLRALPLLLSALLLLQGCVASLERKKEPDPMAAPDIEVSQGRVVMPSGVDLSRILMADQALKTKVYTEMRGIGDPNNEKLLFPRQVASSIGVTPTQMQRRFMDTISRSKRFEVYDSSTSVTADATDVVIEAMVTSTTQDLVPIEGGQRVSVTAVRLSMYMKNRYTGQPLFPGGGSIEVQGQTGRVTGDRVVLGPRDNEKTPEVQARLGRDYERAMQRAFDAAAKRIDAVLRPVGVVRSIDGDYISVTGGQNNGLQRGDRLVVFKGKPQKVGKQTELFGIIPVAAVACSGVGGNASTCEVIRRNPKLTPAVGDYVVLTDVDADGTRLEQ